MAHDFDFGPEQCRVCVEAWPRLTTDHCELNPLDSVVGAVVAAAVRTATTARNIEVHDVRNSSSQLSWDYSQLSQPRSPTSSSQPT